MRKCGKIRAEQIDNESTTHVVEDSGDEPDLLQTIAAGAVQGRTATGDKPGAIDPRLGRGTPEARSPAVKGRLCANLDGFSLHAAVRIPAGLTERLEKLCRYAARPPIVLDRLSRSDDGKIVYKLKKRYRDGSTHVVFSPHTLLERLCALIPRPRRKLVNYYGVFAPAAGIRDRVVPGPASTDDPDELAEPEPVTDRHHRPLSRLTNKRRLRVPHAPAKPHRRQAYYSWSELLRRVFLVEVLTRPHRNGRRRLLAGILDPNAITAVLRSLGLPSTAPAIAPARPPPQTEFAW